MTSQNQAPSNMVNEPTLRYVTCPGASRSDAKTHRMAYWSWGDPQNPRILVCVHGLSRQGRDFDTLARQLADTYQVICPDVVGRGESDWLAEPNGYQVFTYVGDMVALMQQLRAQVQVGGQAGGATEPLTIDWIGTSMGGLIGLTFASLPAEMSGVRVRRFVLNDVGPRLRIEALTRIGEYLGQPLTFPSQQAAADYLWTISSSFGPHTPEQWFALCKPLLKPNPQGEGWILHYDPAISVPFKSMTAESATSGEAMLWQVYDALKCEMLLLRGKESDLLDADTAQAMTQRGPRAKLIEFEGVGHAPTLITDVQIQPIKDFLTS